ncbi:MAG: hypothetical protein KDD01_17825, partial [Phaeodactylibacter sp.]|nr:hypothetical protein [Phaeodactylibacter sp.]
MKLRPFLLWLFFWAAPALGPAQSTSLRFEQLSIEDGLPNPSVIDILQGRQGFMWFGTANGIVRYDGYDMEYFYPAAVGRDNLPERDLPRLYEDKGGNIWLGLANQQARLFRYDPTSGRFIPYLFGPTKKEQPIQVPVSSILEDKLGRLLVGTWGGGLYAADIQKEKEGVAPDKLPYKHFQHVPEDSTSLSNNVISRDMVADGEGNVWLPTDDGLCKFSPGVDRFKSFRFSSENTPAANEISALYLEQPHTLWVGTVVHGLLKFDLETETFIQQYQHQPGAPSSLAHNSVSKILKAKDGKLWLNIIESNSWNSINLLNPLNGQFTPITGYSGTPNSSHFPPVNTMITDYSGNIWVACWQEGVYKYNAGKGAFHFLQPEFFQKNGRRDGRISLPCEDNKGNLWIGTNRMGLIRWNRADNSFDHYVHQPGNPNSLSSNNVHSIAAGANDYLWLGTDTGVEKFDPEAGVFRHYSPFSETPSSVSVETTRSGEVWALSFFKQACRMRSPENGAFTCFPADSGTGRMLGSAVAFEEDNLGNLYFGLNQYGFLRFDPQTEIYEHFLPEYGVHDIHFDRYGNCWLATHSGGLKLFDWQQKRLVHLPEEEQSRIGIARGILEDDHGFLWMKTPTGIVQFDPRERRVKRHFGSSNWLDADELWYGQGTAVKTSTGEMFYSSPNGLLYFHPDSLRIDSTPPKLVLTEFRLFNEKVEPGPDSPLKQAISLAKSVTLPYWQNDLTLAFAALHYKSP